ncbi:MAG: RluA family pseudouridine synthase, partial [Lachnospiraceae bacterium]|nr:RluA family pseudouridine synthase [Lachnospiraceae bacterium]
MITVVIDQQNEGGRLDKFLRRLLKEAGSGFIYKMLRKKNITLNGARAQGNELLRSGDEVRFFFAEETYEKFTGARASQSEDNQAAAQEISGTEYGELSIVYEDKNSLLIYKPAGLLSHRDASGAESANDL